MEAMNIILLLLTILAESQSQLLPLEYYSPNLIENGNFTLYENFTPNPSAHYEFVTSLKNWKCTSYCEINSCSATNTHSSTDIDCEGIVVDLISDKLETLSYDVVLEVGIYIMEFTYYPPSMNNNVSRTKIVLRLNDTIIW